MPTPIQRTGRTQYRFFYNPYGELARVELPTGGAFEYDYAAAPGALAGGHGEVDGGPCCSVKEMGIARRVVERRVYSTLSTTKPEQRATYTATVVNGNISVLEDHFGPNGRVASTMHYYYGDPIPSLFRGGAYPPLAYPAYKEGKEYQTEAQDTDLNRTVLRQVSHLWCQRPPGVSWWSQFSSDPEKAPPYDPRISQTNTVLKDTTPNQTAGQSFLYDQYNNKTDAYEYDYGAAPALPLQCPPTFAAGYTRRTHTDYLTAGYDSTLTVHLRSLPLQQSVFDSGGTEKARTTYEYDNYTTDTVHAALAPRPGISGQAPGFDATNPTRGNVTSRSRYVLPSGPTLSSYQQYDIAGNLVKAIDPNCSTIPSCLGTRFYYDDDFGVPDGEARTNTNPPPTELGTQISYAFPTKAINALGGTVYTQFDYYIGRPVDAEDQNGVVTSAYYNDQLERPTRMLQGANLASPYRMQTTFTYDDPNNKIMTNRDLTAYQDSLLQSQIIYDGFGRAIETRQFEDPSNPRAYITTQQSYDEMGRVQFVGNPCRLQPAPATTCDPNDPTVGWTQTTYDALSRVTRVDTMTGTGVWTGGVQSVYSGNTLTVTDQALNVRRQVTDALGRLVSVTEDPTPGLNYQTSYAYDVLDNLTTVTQGGQTRSFLYDSLKRLTSASNPENGTITYRVLSVVRSAAEHYG